VKALKDPLLFAYRLVSAGLGLAGPLYLYWRAKIGRDDFLRRHERLGRSYLDRPRRRLALLQAASSTDSLALAALIEKLGQRGFSVLLSIREPNCPSSSPSRRFCLLVFGLAPFFGFGGGAA
jgi:3-deoxy-D-manno-octulosonic-acid transferase